MDPITAVSHTNFPLPKGVSLISIGCLELALVLARACDLSWVSMPLPLASFLQDLFLPFLPGENLVTLEDPDLQRVMKSCLTFPGGHTLPHWHP